MVREKIVLAVRREKTSEVKTSVDSFQVVLLRHCSFWLIRSGQGAIAIGAISQSLIKRQWILYLR